MSTKAAVEPNPTLSSERRGHSQAILAVAAGTVALLAAVGAHFGLGIGDSNPAPSTTNGQTEATLPTAASAAIDAYINAVSTGRGEPVITDDTVANRQAAAIDAYVGSYPDRGLKTLMIGR